MYESSIAYGMRKALQAEQGKAEMIIKIQDVEDECNHLEDQVDRLRKDINILLRKQEQEKKAQKAAHLEEVDSRDKENKRVLAEVKAILS